MKENHPNNDSQDLFLAEDPSDTIIGSAPPASDSEIFSDEPETNLGAPLQPQLDEQQYLEAYKHKSVADGVSLALLGTRPAAAHRRTFATLAILLFLAAIGLGVYAFNRGSTARSQLTAAGSLQLNAARLSHSVNAAVAGDEAAFAEVKDSYQNISRSLAQLGSGKSVALIQKNLGSALAPEVETLVAQQRTLQPLIAAANSAHADVHAMQAQVDALKTALLQRNAPANQIMAVADIGLLTERAEKSADRLLRAAANAPEASQQLAKDLSAIEALRQILAEGDSTLGVAALQAEEQAALEKLGQAYEPFKRKVASLLQHEQALAALRQAHGRIIAGVQGAMPNILALSQLLSSSPGELDPVTAWWPYAGMALCGLLALLCVYGIVYVSQADSRRMEMQQKLAEAENSRNQSAILLLMDELQNIADGDLTREATVTEEITGAIADSVNNTVEEWRTLVGNVQVTADKVVQTSADVELTSAILLEASAEQLQAIRDTGQSVLEMAKRINAASYQAKDSALVALRARQAASDGHKAVLDSINGMNHIRDQIQDTSKRIKRLGESSQEIGEITELISDITEQTNVLALNAAIQAASAGEAGRGFSVVAEEVQRLAERSAEATRQIAELVKTIQNDTHDAIVAMERSTQEVVQGAALSDNAGKALEEIDRVSNKLSDLIQQISATTSEEANQANAVASSIQQIFSVTEQATEGTRTTDQTVRELAKVAQELRASISRFKIQ
ncbi:MAG: methyl-accepting chemotaxis protein [Brachymonas sp.]|nr:methyl-accepting chemotaxis protein [Brachymonas sp.]